MSSDNPVSIPQQEQKKETYSEWASKKYGEKRESWQPWLEDLYLRWFGKDNKASYATKQQLDKTKVTGIEQVDNLQDGVNNLVGGQLGKGGLAQPIGDLASKEGVNRAERQGKDDKGGYAPGPLNKVADPVASGAKGAGNQVASGAKGAGSYIGGLWGGKKEGEQK